MCILLSTTMKLGWRCLLISPTPPSKKPTQVSWNENAMKLASTSTDLDRYLLNKRKRESSHPRSGRRSGCHLSHLLTSSPITARSLPFPAEWSAITFFSRGRNGCREGELSRRSETIRLSSSVARQLTITTADRHVHCRGIARMKRACARRAVYTWPVYTFHKRLYLNLLQRCNLKVLRSWIPFVRFSNSVFNLEHSKRKSTRLEAQSSASRKIGRLTGASCHSRCH